MRDLLLIITAVTGLDTADIPLPEIRYVDSMNSLRVWCRAASDHLAGCFTVRDGKPRIYFSTRLPKGSIPFRAYMAHELTHYIQWYHGLFDSYECQQESEVAAYAVSNAVFNSGPGIWRVGVLSLEEIHYLAECAS